LKPKHLGSILVAAGVTSLAFGVFSTARLMIVFVPRMEEATNSQLASFFYASTPQTILWSIAFATFFISGVYLKTRSSESTVEGIDLTKMLKSRESLGTEHRVEVDDERRRGDAEERIRAVKTEVLKAIERLDKLDY